MNYYLSTLSHDNQRPNKLEESFFLYLKSRERELIPEEKLNAFKEEILHKYKELQERFPRCKVKNHHWATSFVPGQMDHRCYCDYVTLILLKCKPLETK